MFPLVRLLGRGRYQGREFISVPGPVLLVGNHISHLDPVYDAVFIRKSGRWPHIMAKASLWKLPVVGRVIRGTEQIPVDRGGGQGQVGLDAAIQQLKDGGVVLIYPEGTVSRDPDLWPMKPRPGVAALALAGDFPVIPLAHWGTQEVFRSYQKKGAFRPWPRKDIHLVCGPAIDLSAYRNLPVDARVIRDVSYVIMGAVRDLLAELRRETPPSTFYDPKKAERLAAAAKVRSEAAPGAGGTAETAAWASGDAEAAETGRADGPER